jgi:predicted nucleotidyltransferase
MRLTREQIDRILSAVHREVGKDAKVYLYGSRLNDQARGGDVDLIIETDDALRLWQKAGIALAIETDLGLPVDVVAVRRGERRTPFQRIALTQAVPLRMDG